MAVKKPSSAALPPSSLLPLPEGLVAHHRPWLQNWMSSWKRKGEVAPVLLLTGPTGSGKRELAHWLSQWMLCERNGPRSHAQSAGLAMEGELFGLAPPQTHEKLEPCGECGACGKALRGTWVDFTELAPDESRSLKIEELRKLRSTLGFGAFDGAYRITLIREADRLTPQAANALLKTLEEPPPGFVFLLTAADPSLLLPTLVSRCQRIRLQPLDEALLSSLLTPEARALSISEAEVLRAARFARGNLHRAREALTPQAVERRRQVLRFLSAPWSELEPLVSAATAEAPELDLLLDHLEALAHELAQWSCLPEAEKFDLSRLERELRPYATDTVRKHGLPRAREFWLARAERAFRARFEATLPLNRKLLTQEILTPWAAGPTE